MASFRSLLRPIAVLVAALVAALVTVLILTVTFSSLFVGSASAQSTPETHTIEIRALGQTGDERMELAVGDQSIATWDVGTELASYTATFDSPPESSAIAVRFINDAYRPPYDRNLLVDYIVVDGIQYETEEQTVLSTGSYNPGDGCKDGFKRSELLSCQGQFVYDVQVGGNNGGNGGGPTIEGVIEHCGEIATDEVWSPNVVHVVTCPVTVADGSALTIGAGSIVKYEPEESGAGIIVANGASLDVRGSEANPVIFTSNFDDARGGDTNGHRSNSTLRPGRYGTAITISPGSTTRVQHALIDYASVGVGDLGSPVTDPALLTIARTTIQNSLYLGVNLDEPQSQPVIGTTTFVDNILGAIRIGDGASVSKIPVTGASGNTFRGNAAARAFYLSGVTIPAGNAWVFGPERGAVAVLEGDRSLSVDGRLSIRAGSTIKVGSKSPTAGLYSNPGGAILIAGSANAPVAITSITDDTVAGDTNGDGSASTPRVGSYSTGISIASTSSVAATNTTIRFAENGIAGERTNADSSTNVARLILTDSVVAANRYFGVHLNQTRFNATIETTTFRNNGLGGLRVAAGSSVAGIVTNGADANTFVGDAQSRQLWLAGAVLPQNRAWTFDPAIGAHLSLEKARSFDILGDATLKAGTVAKISSNSRQAGFRVSAGGTLKADGTSSKPVVFTSVVDDKHAGDSNGDGTATTAKIGNYRTAVTVGSGATFAGNNVDIGYSRVGIADGKATSAAPAVIDLKNASIHDAQYFAVQIDQPNTKAAFQRTTIENATTGLSVTDGGLRFRGSILDTKRGIQACDFGGSCTADARFVDWGDARGPFKANGKPLVCGQVEIGKWKNQPAAAAGTNFIRKNCDGSAA